MNFLSVRNGQDEHAIRACLFQDPCAFARRGARSENVVHQRDPAALEFRRIFHDEGAANIPLTLFSIQVCLRGRIADAAQVAGTERLAKSFAQMTGENLGLIKSPLSFAARMEWYGHDDVNGGPFDTNGSAIGQPVAEMSIQEKLALILEAVDAFPHNARRTAAANGGLKKQCHSRASATLKFRREFTLEWRTTSTAAGRTNPLNATQTESANPAQVVFGQWTGTESTVVRIDKTDGGLDPTHDDFLPRST